MTPRDLLKKLEQHCKKTDAEFQELRKVAQEVLDNFIKNEIYQKSDWKFVAVQDSYLVLETCLPCLINELYIQYSLLNIESTMFSSWANGMVTLEINKPVGSWSHHLRNLGIPEVKIREVLLAAEEFLQSNLNSIQSTLRWLQGANLDIFPRE